MLQKPSAIVKMCELQNAACEAPHATPPLRAVARLRVKRGLWQKRLWRLAKNPLEHQALDAAQAAHSNTDFQMLVARYVRQSLFEFLSMVCGNTGEDASGKGRYFFEKMIA